MVLVVLLQLGLIAYLLSLYILFYKMLSLVLMEHQLQHSFLILHLLFLQ
jgi:hypothetical protein